MHRSVEDLGQPLSEVTFAVIDLETTGVAPSTCAITEVGAVKLRGGECLGRFQTLVNPGVAIPPPIVYLTGITDAMVGPAPTVGSVLSSLLEFIGDSVVVGHNVRFDVGFIDAELARRGMPHLGNRTVDTCILARRLVREDVPDCRLGTLARHLRLDHLPSHRALDDAVATGELLHVLLERAGTFGVLGLGDLLELPSMTGHAQASKLRLTAALPRRPGVYLFLDGARNVIYVGKAANLRQRVRSYFSTDERRKIGGLLRQAVAIEHRVCSGPLESLALEIRLIHKHEPRFNTRAKAWRRYAYVKLTLDEPFPRLSVVRTARAGDGCLYLGPVGSVRTARQLVDAIETAVPVRQCRGRITSRAPDRGAGRPHPHCPTRSLGLRACPCQGGVSSRDYRVVVDRLVRGITVDPEALLGPLRERIHRLAAEERFEEAAEIRDRAAALARALARQRRMDALRAAGRVRVLLADGSGADLLEGRVVTTWGRTGPPGTDPAPRGRVPASSPWPWPLAAEAADEVAAVASWLESNAGQFRLASAEHGWAQPAPAVTDFTPTAAPPRGPAGSGPGARAQRSPSAAAA